MFEWIGFVASIIISGYIIAMGAIGLFAKMSFSGKWKDGEGLMCIAIICVGLMMVYGTCVHAPFVLEIKVK